jgi:hypothetical protein
LVRAWGMTTELQVRLSPEDRTELESWVAGRNTPSIFAQKHCAHSNAKMRFQSFFVLITIQPFFMASS